ncbi:MAG: hypothetical protein ABI655_10980 [Phenylobacterium sp.]
MASTQRHPRRAGAADMEMLRAEVCALGRRLTSEQMIELADLLRYTANPGTKTWVPDDASPQ